MRTLINFTLAGLIALLMIGGPIAYKCWRDQEYRNFHVVEAGVLYRSGQQALEPLQRLVMEHGIRTIVCLRDSQERLELQEEAWVKSQKKLKFVRIPPRQWYPDATGNIPAEAGVQTFREIMDDPANYPVLVHCFAGIHRTGTMCAIFRMDHQRWSREKAMTEMRTFGYTMLDEYKDVQSYLMNYRPHQPSRSTSDAMPVSRQKSGHP